MSTEFKRELKDLLEKYGADIAWVCDDCSDLYGVSGEQMVVTDGSDNRLLIVEGSSIDASDLKD